VFHLNGPKAQFKVQCGFAAVQSSKFNAPPPQFKVLCTFRLENLEPKVTLKGTG